MSVTLTRQWTVLALACLLSLTRSADSQRTRWWDEAWESRLALDVHKTCRGTLTDFPLTVPTGFLDLPKDTAWHTLRLVDAAGKLVPMQVDPCDAMGIGPARHELAFLADLEAAETRFYLYYSTKQLHAPEQPQERSLKASFDADANPSVSNGLIRLHDGRFSCRAAGAETYAEFLVGDGTLSFDAYDYSGSKVTGWRTRVVSNGPVRAILRRVSTEVRPAHERTRHPAVPAEVSHEWQVYHGRSECFVTSRIRNVSPGKDVLTVARGWSWLEVRLPEAGTRQSFWTASVRGWKSWTDAMAGGRRTELASTGLTQDLRLAEEWLDAYAEGPTREPGANVGFVFHPLSTRYKLWAGDREDRFRVVILCDSNWRRVPAGGSLWLGYWVIPHRGSSDEVRDFWLATRNIDVIPGPVETLEARSPLGTLDLDMVTE